MTEAEWLAGADVIQMLDWSPSDDGRKLRLFARACARLAPDLIQSEPDPVYPEPARREGGEPGAWDWRDHMDNDPWFAACDTARSGVWRYRFAGSADLDVHPDEWGPIYGRRDRDLIPLVHDIFGNPFRPVATDPAWLTPTVLSLADGIYEERAFDRLPILADALQDAGCEHPDLLAHCRGDGPHARGCWVVDLLLGKP